MPRGKQMALHGEALDLAVRLYDVDGLSMEAVARAIGMPASTVQNGVMAALCVKRGYRPAERDDNGYLNSVGLERLRAMLRKGMKGVDIQLRLAVSASSISNERRRYSAELRERGKRPLPPLGGGTLYCGARLSRAQVKVVEAELMTGLGAQQVAKRTGVSHTSVGRIRNRLIKRLGRKRECLPGCDKSGKRIKLVNQIHEVPAAAIDKLRGLILDRVPVSRAAMLANIGSKSAYRIRDQLRNELLAEGKQLQPPIKLGRIKAREADYRAGWLPPGRANMVLYRTMLREADGDEAVARRRTIRAIAERDGEDPALAEQFDRLRRGATVSRRPVLRSAGPAYTLGGVAPEAL